ncbi:MAG: malolactic enzyme [Lactobacillus panisapium]|uniref:malolactic enzyme n=1 Tax=Lactobacillus TaxID=1578 RepID=UPI001C6957BD|nr:MULTISPECIES: malolactic enzyme [Lactobacillus]MCO6532209.1 NAD-dependent malic enzyme [Lactobacillus sp.]MCO6535754.1 NAD-dependent malic enzyme [Lactobacillus sp.]MCT6821212.1 NAD-dependent malic enzyme [Lactobacillus panisapium]MCT6853836.1 NAD-dependent malic enzyme [Lactobacillus panisapium]QYN58073.1 NAD-dependent malic enzyme [Lactobacillus panisapium]
MEKTGQDRLNDPFLNHGTAFTEEQRKQYHLEGMLPPQEQSLESQVREVYLQYQEKSTNLEKRIFLMTIFNTNRVLFFKIFSEHVTEFMPIVYDPTIAETIENYSHLFVNPQNAAFLSIDKPDQMEASLKNAADGRDIKLIVVTDGEEILGIGDWGTQGVDISVGKLMVYTAAAGVDPACVLPVVLDVGTNNEKLLKDDLYLGNKHSRVNGDKYYQFVDQFVQCVEKLFPGLYLHFEDFGRDNADNILKKYRDHILTFNDDIQGTGIIVLAGILGALKISGQKLTEQKYVCFGAGTAGTGIVEQVYSEMLQAGLKPEEARQHFYLVDKQGLLFDDTPDLTPAQKPFVRKRSEFANADQLKDLKSVVQAVHPDILVGTSTRSGAFTQDIVTEMAEHTERPIIFPLSNPTQLAEAKAQDLIEWTKGKALVATGIPADPVDYQGVKYEIGQANNALVYPGLGLGALAVNAKVLSDEMISVAAHSLGGIVDSTKPGAAVLPPVEKLNIFSQTVAHAVANQAIKDHLNQNEYDDGKQAVEALRWAPEYKNE